MKFVTGRSAWTSRAGRPRRLGPPGLAGGGYGPFRTSDDLPARGRGRL